jgi:GNAT superfamily N-acetyltransferase
MDTRYCIAPARVRDIAALGAIERAAASMLEGHAPEEVIEEVTEDSEFLEAQRAGLLWVGLFDDEPVGFALVSMLGHGLPHLEEIDVHPQHGRRGIGAALVRAVCEWASRVGHVEVTLTTFRSLPWNMPFYTRLGFREVPPDELSPELCAVVEDETARGLDPAGRVVMRYRTDTGAVVTREGDQ